MKIDCSRQTWTGKWMNKLTNEQMNKWTNEQMDKWTNGQMTGRTNKWRNEWKNEQFNKRMVQWTRRQTEISISWAPVRANKRFNSDLNLSSSQDPSNKKIERIWSSRRIPGFFLVSLQALFFWDWDVFKQKLVLMLFPCALAKNKDIISCPEVK